jgi:hypothetical protein
MFMRQCGTRSGKQVIAPGNAVRCPYIRSDFVWKKEEDPIASVLHGLRTVIRIGVKRGPCELNADAILVARSR